MHAFQAAGQPAIPVGTKKKEPVGDFKNVGRELRPKGQPEPVRAHDFALPELGKVAPYGVYDIASNTGWANLGIPSRALRVDTSDTAAFAVESIRRWWHEPGQLRHPDAKRLLITADCGGSNGVRVQLWKTEPQALADQTRLSITVAHLPPGTPGWRDGCFLRVMARPCPGRVRTVWLRHAPRGARAMPKPRRGHGDATPLNGGATSEPRRKWLCTIALLLSAVLVRELSSPTAAGGLVVIEIEAVQAFCSMSK